MNTKVIAASLAALIAVPAQAAILVDGSPTGSYYGSWANQANGQNFLVQFTLGSASTITGFDIFTCCNYGDPATPVTVRIRNDVGGSPSAANLYEFNDTVSTEIAFDADTYVSSVDFAGINLAAGTYWFGVSGSVDELSWSSYNNGGPLTPGGQWQLQGNNLQLQPAIYDLAYRVVGTAGAIPEPTTWALLILGFGAVGGALRRSAVNRPAGVRFAF